MNSKSLESITGVGPPETQSPVPMRWQRRMAASIPWFLLAGFALLAWVLFGDRLLPATPVRTETVVTLRQTVGGEVAASTGEKIDPFEAAALFQASGWVEPDPLPVMATALVNGVVETVTVLEGETVKKGDLLATLIREDFDLDLASAEAEMNSLEAEARAHEAAIDAAAAKIKTLHKKVKAGEMKCLELEDRRDRMVRAGRGAISESEIEQAKLMLQTHGTVVEALLAEEVELVAERSRLEAMRATFKADLRKAFTEVARKKLALDRTKILSPIDGIVFHLHAVPGQKRMLDMDDPKSATIAELYQPERLQARIDVPLEEAARLSVGQAVRLRSSFLSDKVFFGTVTRIVGQADLQRNTLQAKVRIEQPDRRLRPEMLCRAEFLAATTNGEGKDSSKEKASTPTRAAARVAVFVPESALVDREGSKAAVWTVDSENRLERRSLTLDSEERDGHLRVREGLRPGDRVVMNPSPAFSEGERVQPENEEEENS